MTALILESKSPPAKRRLYKGKPHIAEADVLSSVLEYLAYCHAVAWAHRINTGKFKVNDRAGTRWVQSGFVGCADIIGQLTDGRFLAIECKSVSGKLTNEQQVFLDVVNNAHGVGFVARSVDDVVRIFRELRVL